MRLFKDEYIILNGLQPGDKIHVPYGDIKGFVTKLDIGAELPVTTIITECHDYKTRDCVADIFEKMEGAFDLVQNKEELAVEERQLDFAKRVNDAFKNSNGNANDN